MQPVCVCRWLHTTGFNGGTAITWLYELYNVISFLISENVSRENIYSHTGA
jgi:hypothetical protein